MDLFTHALFPYLLGNFFKRKKDEVSAFVIGGIAPDFDVLIIWINFVYPNFFLTTHRGLTHSLFFGFFTAVIIMYAASRKRDIILRYLKLSPDINFTRHSIGFMYLGVLIHLFLDFLTTRGVPLLYPFEVNRWSAELFFYTDSYLALLSLIGIVWLYRTRSLLPDTTARKILALFLAVFLILGTARYVEKSDAQASFENAKIFPTMNMYKWYALEENETEIGVFEYNSWNRTTGYQEEIKRINFISEGPGFNDVLNVARELPQVKMFEWKAHAVAINVSYKDSWLIEFFDPVQRAEMRNVPIFLRNPIGRFMSIVVEVENGKARVIEKKTFENSNI